ncbi:unnamed protein product [Blepharisma stoltei]|uniref:MRH domain-containing protein n=1 Tax=Blepharisma stoltei TaxID=1481888 RepID=A0AAU9KGN4_9CILI|nr:unnamed protein product [Blepharisma stoltei]
MLWLFLSVAYGLDCFDHAFTDCEEDNTRTAIFYPNGKCNSTEEIPKPITNISCAVNCPAGTFLDVNLTSYAPICATCPANTYSIGGGERFSGDEKDWIDYYLSFSTYCWTMGYYNWELNSNCSPWSSLDGNKISSGSANEDTWFESSLVYHAFLVKNGTVKFTYRKDISMHNNSTNGQFHVYIDDNQAYRDNDISQIGWKTVTLDLTPGLHNIAFTYDKYSTNEENQAEIKYFEIRGIQNASHFCSPCPSGFSNPGSDECDVCGMNTYYSTNASEKCSPCPDGFYSLPGSTSWSDCRQRKECTANDYSWKFSSCINGSRSKVYSWNCPMICNNNTLVLPDDENGIPCETCNAGYYHKIMNQDTLETECEPCPTGTSMTETQAENQCVDCQAGFYAPKVLNFTHWSTIPAEFENHCIPSNSNKCSLSSGWEARGTHISSGDSADFNSNIVLVRRVTITENDAYVSFNFSMKNVISYETRLLFFIDGILKGSYHQNSEGFYNYSFPLTKGIKSLKWDYRHYSVGISDPKDECKIYSIEITGSKEGGAPTCVQCPAGHISVANSDECTPCPAGTTSDDSHISCVECPKGTFSDLPGQSCTACPEYSIVNQNHTACIISDYLILKNGTYYISPLTGIQGMNEGNQSHYCNDESMKLYCHDTFYGPVMANEDYFYLSVVNPSNFSLPTYSNYDFMRKGYAFGIINKSQIPYIENDPTQPSAECVKDYSMAVVNVGSRLTSIQETPTGFVISYGAGSKCKAGLNKRFISQINFICDKTESEGWPVFQGQIDCVYAFRWKTIRACKICTSAMMIEKRSYCDNGKRTVQLYESPDCVVANGTSYKSWEEKCSVNEDLIQTWQVIVGLIFLGVLVIVSIVLCLCFCKFKRKYTKLIEYRIDDKPQIKEIELAQSE